MMIPPRIVVDVVVMHVFRVRCYCRHRLFRNPTGHGCDHRFGAGSDRGGNAQLPSPPFALIRACVMWDDVDDV